MIKVSTASTIKVTLKGKDLTNVRSAFKKLCDPKIGFKNVNLTEDEVKTIKKLQEKL